MTDKDRNKRTAGYRRINAVFERMRTKRPLEERGERRPFGLKAPTERELVVMLLVAPPEPTGERVCRAAESAFPGSTAGDAAYDEPDGTVHIGDWEFGVRWASQPFFSPEELDRFSELRLRRAIENHVAWIAVELLLSPAGTSSDEKSGRTCRLLSALAEEGFVLHCPQTGETTILTPAGRVALDRGRASEAFAPDDRAVPITHISDDDPRMIAAVNEARNRFGEFLSALESRSPGDTFSIKVPFKDEHGCEFMWVSVEEVDDTHVRGKITNDPAFVKSVQAGAAVNVARSEVNDWLFVRDGEMHGGFTLKLLDNKLRHGE